MGIRIRGAIRNYPWGSTTAIPEMLGQEPDGRPAAELWLGAHPADPSLAVLGGAEVPLDELLVRERHLLAGHTELPFLMKVLAADKALSLQAHPDRLQAAKGYARGELCADGSRRYVDAQHKPELIVALTPFRALSGTRPLIEAFGLVALLDVPDLTRLCAFAGMSSPSVPRPRAREEEQAGGVASLDLPSAPTSSREPQNELVRAEGDALHAVLETLLSLPHAEKDRLVTQVCEAADALVESTWDQAQRYYGLVRLLSRDHPGDIGIVVAAFLNDIDLAPGEALYQPAGVLHAYVRGAGVEVMGNSDNVMRCGLTRKPLDLQGLLSILDPRPGLPLRPQIGPRPWTSPSGDFMVSRLTLDGTSHTVDPCGPAIVLCTVGRLELTDDAPLTLDRGQAAFVPGGGAWTLAGMGNAVVAAVPPRDSSS